MEKKFQPAPLDVLARWVLRGLDHDQVMGMPRADVVVPDKRLASNRFGQWLETPLGVAAGPHTQLAQNIVSAWLYGARFIELKTVQVLDEISVSRPCIDALDATFNCEWSQELTLEQSFREYLHAWVLLHALAHKLGRPGPGVIFNMSVGYDLNGIRSEKVQSFIRRMRDASAELPAAIDAVASVYPAVREVSISPVMTNLVTLSTMHGCPPKEIERIARHFIEELGLHTWVKLNPTLLGPQLLRGILNDTLGFGIPVPDAAFEHDPRFDDAMVMVNNLEQAARAAGVQFGIKLSNTLEVHNYRNVFPPNEKMMYMSGRALHPLTVTLADKVTQALQGRVPISFCGGADAFNVASLVASGLAPVTTCTDLLKPGGYARLAQYVDNLQAAMDRTGADSLEALAVRWNNGEQQDAAACARANLHAYAEKVVTEPRYRERSHALATKGQRKLGYFDCIAAPCQEACPAHQNIPDYMHLVASGRPAEALQVILRTNAMPAVTGRVCDHPCVEKCVRNHYDAPLAIRHIKRFAVESRAPMPKGAPADPHARVAIIGAGPMGLSAAYYLAQAGFSVTIFEAREQAGGMVSGVIPSYRLPITPILEDVSRVRELGVELRLGEKIEPGTTLEALQQKGYEHVIVAAGAQRGRTLGIPGQEAPQVMDALGFLSAVRAGELSSIGPRVLVIGGGNSAMDAARTALRVVPQDGSVAIVYRRTRAQMPADPEEIEACVEEGIAIRDLLAPVRVQVQDGKVTGLVCNRMRLGEPDASGRPRPVMIPGDECTIACDTILVGISQEPELAFLEGWGLERHRDGTLKVDEETCETSVINVFAGGDVARGPATIIKAVADGRRIAATIAARHGVALDDEPGIDKHVDGTALLQKRSRRLQPQPVPSIDLSERRSFNEVLLPFEAQAAAREASRCLDCDEMCSLCVTVCPNRANQAWPVRPWDTEVPSFVVRDGSLVVDALVPFGIKQQWQIINVADFCNECGNCTSFCPTAGAPFRDKPRFFLDRSAYETAPFNAFYAEQQNGTTRLEARVDGQVHVLERTGEALVYRGPQVEVRWDARSKAFVEAEAATALADGQQIDMRVCADMMALIDAVPTLPSMS